MSRLVAVLTLLGISLFAQLNNAHERAEELLSSWKATAELAAPEANQAAAADERFAYAIDNAVVAKYDRATGQRVAISTGEAEHLNSSFLHEGRLYCAHSNYPRKPERSEIKVLDPDTMQLSTFKDFGSFGGSLTWAVLEDGHWWCNFALYREENAKTFLVKFDRTWKEVARYSYPPEVIEQLKSYSLSGGIWHKGSLLVTDHDHRVLYELQLPESGNVLKFLGKHPSSFTGQGIAADPKTGGLVGIDRGKKKIIFAQPAE